MAQEIYGTYQCTYFKEDDHTVGDGSGNKAHFMDRDILKEIANVSIKAGIAHNKSTKSSKKISVIVSSEGCFINDDSGATLFHIPGIVFHCLVMGQNSMWSKKQMAVLMSRQPDGKSLKVHCIEFPKKKMAAAMFQSFVKLMEHLKAAQASRNFTSEAGHEDAPDDEDGEYLSIMTSGPF